jgi:uncharacterized protein YjbJ (UPF0337 family)
MRNQLAPVQPAIVWSRSIACDCRVNHAVKPQGRDIQLWEQAAGGDRQRATLSALRLSILFRPRWRTWSDVMNKDQMHGWTKEIAGTIRAHIGRIIGNRAVTLKGRIGQVIGKTQASYGDAKARIKKRW